ncbi:hypothetical protein JB92DRAFT_3148451 [Gautieria morchelliformis]|nr:hypothetical protein JB92DRAFT_3148451 [Gautieria morchelliformis]
MFVAALPPPRHSNTRMCMSTTHSTYRPPTSGDEDTHPAASLPTSGPDTSHPMSSAPTTSHPESESESDTAATPKSHAEPVHHDIPPPSTAQAPLTPSPSPEHQQHHLSFGHSTTSNTFHVRKWVSRLDGHTGRRYEVDLVMSNVITLSAIYL